MKKIDFPNTHLTCYMQDDAKKPDQKCWYGVISKNPKSFVFQEAIPHARPARNPKLFEGTYLNLVRMRNGRYQCHLKTLPEVFDPQDLVARLYSEIVSAISLIH